MNKIITIRDYNNRPVPIEIKNFENVVRLTIKVISGDEILYVLYKDYTEEEYDSYKMIEDMGRIYDFFDDEYIIYDTTKNIDYINNWKKRESSYNYKLKEGKK